MSLKNPKECFCLQQQQTFFVLNELTPSTCENGSEPLTFHHETFSRFRFVIINKDKKAATANIPVSEIPGIFEEIKNKNLLKKMKKIFRSASVNNIIHSNTPRRMQRLKYFFISFGHSNNNYPCTNRSLYSMLN